VQSIALVLVVALVVSTADASPINPFDDDPPPSEPTTGEEPVEPTEPSGSSAPTQSKPVARVGCRREDFADFDDFVDCQVREAERSAPPEVRAAPASRRPPDPRDAERREIESMLHAKFDPQIEEAEQERTRFFRISIGLLVPGCLAAAGGIITAVIGAGVGSSTAREDTAGGDDIDGFRDQCTIGKPCGDTCIEVSDVCHVGGGGVGGGGELRPGVLIAGVSIAVLGIGLLVGSVLAARRSKEAGEHASDLRRRRDPGRLTFGPSGLRVRF
jgi:hypothetical protein